MIRLFDVNEENWLDVASLSVSEEQKRFLDRPIGIIARGYVYRSCNARVFGISDGQQVIGVALVKDIEEEPACYDLQQFMIDRRFQHKGYGTKALSLILSLLSREGRYSEVEVCVHKDNTAALRMYQRAGFEDTGYIDENVPDCYNLMYHFSKNEIFYSDTWLSDFSDPKFREAFRQYFSELDVSVQDWDELFQDMNGDGNTAIVRTDEQGKVIGFIQFKSIKFSSWFFEETCGFIREFWVAEEFRSRKHGTELIGLAEKYFVEKGIFTSILTTDTAMHFYEKCGYVRAPGCIAENDDNVFIKHLRV